MKTYAIILAAGIGSRIKPQLPKQFLSISGKTILEYSVEVFSNHSLVDEIIMVVPQKFIGFCEKLFHENRKISQIVAGAETRQISSSIGIESIADGEAKVLIHDAARPCVTSETISECIMALNNYVVVSPAISPRDTTVLKKNNTIEEFLDRNQLLSLQTPQAFKLSVIRKAHDLAKSSKITSFSDDAGIIKFYDIAPIHAIPGDETNIKITYPIDLKIAEQILLNK